jgi:putative acetyltransferase
VEIRLYEPGNAEKLCKLFFDAVRVIGLRDYNAHQVEAWAQRTLSPAQFNERATDGRLVLVVIDGQGDPIAYGDLEPDGHIDHIYCRPDMVGKGVASALYDEMEKLAQERRIEQLYVEASEAARHLFVRKGFRELEQREFQVGSVSIHNYAMVKIL